MVFLWYNLAIILILKILFEVIMSWPEETAYERYPSDLTDEEWEIVKPILEKLDPYTTGRPRKVDLREVLNAIFYLNKTGCPWRYLPTCFIDTFLF